MLQIHPLTKYWWDGKVASFGVSFVVGIKHFAKFHWFIFLLLIFIKWSHLYLFWNIWIILNPNIFFELFLQQYHTPYFFFFFLKYLLIFDGLCKYSVITVWQSFLIFSSSWAFYKTFLLHFFTFFLSMISSPLHKGFNNWFYSPKILTTQKNSIHIQLLNNSTIF